MVNPGECPALPGKKACFSCFLLMARIRAYVNFVEERNGAMAAKKMPLTAGWGGERQDIG